MRCPRCDGSGRDYSEWDDVCRVCAGFGKVRKAVESNEVERTEPLDTIPCPPPDFR